MGRLQGAEQDQDQRLKILVTVPNVHWIHQHVVIALLRLQGDPRFRVTIDLPSKRPYENNLHHIFADFRESDYDFWLNIDADNPPLNNPLDLVELDCDLIGLPTPIWHYLGNDKERPIYWNAYRWDAEAGAFREWMSRDGLQRVDAIGTGCFLMAHRVSEVMRGPVFSRTLDEHGRVDFGNDLAFCMRAKKLGVEIYAHYDYPCRHFSEVDLHEVALSIKGLIE